MGATLSSRQPAFKLENWCENSCEDCLKIVLRTRDELQGTAIHHLPSEEARLWEKKRSSSRNWASKVLPTRQCRAFSAATRAICGSRYVSSSIALVRQKVRALPLYAPRSACSVIDFNDAQPYSSVIRAWCAKSFRSIRPYWASYWVALSLLLSFYLALLSTIEF